MAETFRTDTDRWEAVLRRDRQADGKFYYSVKSTGVYCRPSCASRRPRYGNIAFHATGPDAERAGFRPCKRCQPEKTAIVNKNAVLIADACRLIEASDELPDLTTIAHTAGMSRFHFHRTFK